MVWWIDNYQSSHFMTGVRSFEFILITYNIFSNENTKLMYRIYKKEENKQRFVGYIRRIEKKTLFCVTVLILCKQKYYISIFKFETKLLICAFSNKGFY